MSCIMKKRFKMLAFLLSTCMILESTGMQTLAMENQVLQQEETVFGAENEITSGGDEEVGSAADIDSGEYSGISWRITAEGELIITGTSEGGLNLYRQWEDYTEQITSATVSANGLLDCSNLFSKCSNLTSVDLSGLDTSQVTDMMYMFNGCSSLESVDVSKFDTSQVVYACGMFAGCSSLSLVDVSHFNTSKMTDINWMFYDCSSLGSVNVTNFDTSQVTDMNSMFSGCTSLYNVDVTGFDTSKVTNMSGMFSGCCNLSSLDVSSFNTSQVTKMSNMFNECSNLRSLNVSRFDTSQVTDMWSMFGGCTNLSSLDVSKFDTSQVTDMRMMFSGCTNLSSLDLSSFDTSQVTNMFGMFTDCNNLKQLQTPKNVTVDCALPQTMYDSEDNEYTYLPKNNEESILLVAKESSGTDDGSDEGSETDIASGEQSGVVWRITSEGELIITGTYNGEGISFSWTPYEEQIKHAKISVKELTTCYRMFADCSELTSVDLSEFDTSKVMVMGSMFEGCSNLSSLDVSKFNTSNVIDMSKMFLGCSSLESLDLSSFDTSQVTEMGNMFALCSNLSSLNLSGFDANQVTDMSYMLLGCVNLRQLQTPKNVSVDCELPHAMYDSENNEYTYLPKNQAESILLVVQNSEESGDVSDGDVSGGDEEQKPDQGGTDDGNDPGQSGTDDGNDPGQSGTDDGGDDDEKPGQDPEIPDVIPEEFQKGFWVAPVDDQIYTGKAVTPKVRVYDDSMPLIEGVDYTISYKNNIQAAEAPEKDGFSATAPMVIVKGKGNYAGTISRNFTITAKELTEENTTLDVALIVEDGTEHKPAPKVTVDGKKLKAGTDYEVTYPDKVTDAYKKAGTYTYVVTGKGNYQGSVEGSIKIAGKDQILATKLKVGNIAACTYEMGKACTPAPVVTYQKEELKAGVDYIVSYVNNDKAGKATVIITGLENAAGKNIVGSIRKTFIIKGIPMKKVKVDSYDATMKYTGKELKPAVSLSYEGKKLTEGTDYSITYQKNTAAGKGTIVIKGCGGFTGSIKKTFVITPVEEVAVSFASGTDTTGFVKSGAKPAVKVVAEGVTLTEKKDYTVTYKNNKKILDKSAEKAPVVVIKGKGNYKFQTELKFSITAKNLSEEDITVFAPDKLQKGKGSQLSVPVVTDEAGKKLKKNTDYEVVGYFVNGKAYDGSSTLTGGTVVTVKVSGNGNYTGTAEATYKVVEKDIAKMTVVAEAVTLEHGVAVYTEDMLKNGAIKVTDKATGKTLEYGKDYVVTGYKNNTKKGKGTVILKGISDTYGGVKNVKFKVVVKNMEK